MKLISTIILFFVCAFGKAQENETLTIFPETTINPNTFKDDFPEGLRTAMASRWVNKDTGHVHYFPKEDLPQHDMGNGWMCAVAHFRLSACVCGARPTISNLFPGGTISIPSSGKGQIDYKGLDTAKTALLIWNMDSVGFKPLLAYEVREKYCCKNGHPEGFGAYYPVPFYQHLYYLDENKMPLPKNIIVWDSKTIE